MALALLVAGCGSWADQPLITSEAETGGRPSFAPVDQQPQSREQAKLIATYGGVYSNPRIEHAVARVVGRLVAASDDPARSYRITILNSPAVNAFALPSGDLFLSRGLLALASDESELAAVIAHEMAHVTARHAAQRQRRAHAVAVAGRVLGNMVNDPVAARAAKQSTEVSLAQFSQTQELEADAIGIRTLAGAGFDPFAASRFLEAMAEFAGLPAISSGASDTSDFLSSHPSTPSRISSARERARRFGTPAPTVGSFDYLSGLDGLLFGDDPREGFVRGQDFLHTDLGIGFTVPAGFTLRNSPDAVLATDGQQTAIRFDGVAVPPNVPLSSYLRSGWVNGLVRESVRAGEVNGLDAASAAAIVEGWSFRIGVLRDGGRAYRFIFASSSPGADFDDTFDATFDSFRKLSRAERASLKPQRLRVVSARPADTVESLADRMSGVAPAQRPALFKALNGLDADERIRPGARVKIVAD